MKSGKITIRIIEGSNKEIKLWDNFVNRHKLSSIFYSYDWLKVIEEGLDYYPTHLVVEKESNIIGCIPCFIESTKHFKRLSSIPHGGVGILLGSYEKESLNMILDKINELIKKENLVSHRIIINDFKHLQYGNYLYQYNYKLYLSGCRFVINLGRPLPEIEKSFSSSRRYEIRKTKNSPIKIKSIELSFKNIELFYSIYQNTIMRVNGKILPFSFFDKLIQYLKSVIKIFVAYYEEEWIAAFLYIIDYQKQTIYHYFGASKDEYKQFFPNILLHYYCIRWAHEKGLKCYDMYGSSFFTDSIFKFKKQWGGEIVPNFIWEKYSNSLKGFLYEYGTQYIKKHKSIKKVVKKLI